MVDSAPLGEQNRRPPLQASLLAHSPLSSACLASAVRSIAVQANPEGRPQSGKTAARSVVRDLDKLGDLSGRAAEAGRRHMRVQDPQVPL